MVKRGQDKTQPASFGQRLLLAEKQSLLLFVQLSEKYIFPPLETVSQLCQNPSSGLPVNGDTSFPDVFVFVRPKIVKNKEHSASNISNRCANTLKTQLQTFTKIPGPMGTDPFCMSV